MLNILSVIPALVLVCLNLVDCDIGKAQNKIQQPQNSNNYNYDCDNKSKFLQQVFKSKIKIILYHSKNLMINTLFII